MPSTEPSSERAEIRETARISTVEGAFAQVYLTLAYPGSVFITKFAVLLGATPFQFGVLAAIGQLSQVFQLLGVAISRKLTSRKGAVIRLSSLGRALALFYGVLPLLLPAEAAIVCFLLLYFVSTSLQAASANLWVAWISDMIPLSMRGRFFARRSQVLLLAGLLTGYAFGALVDLFDPRPGPLAGVLISLLPGRAFFVASHQRYALLAVFVLAAVAGGIGLRILSRQPERPKVADRESFWRMVRVPLGDANFRRLLLYGLWWMLAVGIGAPFWGPL